jgi:murein DD-endopeptidase MepM/ murein hydrolase activator NlpD
MPAVAVADGTVTIQAATAAELEGAEGAGNFVVLDLGGGIKVRYLHLASFETATDTTVKRGDKLGMLGKTGSPDSPHLHFEVYANGTAVDPIPHLKDTAKNWAFPAAVMR